MTQDHREFFGESDEVHPAIGAAIKALSKDRRDPRDVGHELISAGLCHFRATCCNAHVIEELEFVQVWIAEKLAALRGVN